MHFFRPTLPALSIPSARDSFINEYYRKVKERAKTNDITRLFLKMSVRLIFLRTEDIDLINEINKETILRKQPEARFAWLRSKES